MHKKNCVFFFTALLATCDKHEIQFTRATEMNKNYWFDHHHRHYRKKNPIFITDCSAVRETELNHVRCSNFIECAREGTYYTHMRSAHESERSLRVIGVKRETFFCSVAFDQSTKNKNATPTMNANRLRFQRK